jgi:hypothetical protein
LSPAIVEADAGTAVLALAAGHKPDFGPGIGPILIVTEQDVLSVGDDEDGAGIGARHGHRTDADNPTELIQENPGTTGATRFHLPTSISNLQAAVQDSGQPLGRSEEIGSGRGKTDDAKEVSRTLVTQNLNRAGQLVSSAGSDPIRRL